MSGLHATPSWVVVEELPIEAEGVDAAGGRPPGPPACGEPDAVNADPVASVRCTDPVGNARDDVDGAAPLCRPAGIERFGRGACADEQVALARGAEILVVVPLYFPHSDGRHIGRIGRWLLPCLDPCLPGWIGVPRRAIPIVFADPEADLYCGRLDGVGDLVQIQQGVAVWSDEGRVQGIRAGSPVKVEVAGDAVVKRLGDRAEQVIDANLVVVLPRACHPCHGVIRGRFAPRHEVDVVPARLSGRRIANRHR